MKKLFSVLLACLLLFASFSLAGCKKTAGKFVVLEENFGTEDYGIGFRNEDIAFGLAVQEILDEMIADGTAAKISEKWFGEDIIVKDADYVEPDQTVAPAGDNSLANIQAKGKFVVGLDENFPPMGFREENNELAGLDIDLAKEVAARLGVEVTFQPIDWDAKEMELQSGNIDAIWNGMTITEERIENMYFAKPYLKNRQVIIVSEDSGIKTKADLASKVIGLQKGSSSLKAFESDPATAASVKEVLQFPENVSAFMDLKAGRIDAFVVDEVAGRYIMSQNS